MHFAAALATKIPARSIHPREIVSEPRVYPEPWNLTPRSGRFTPTGRRMGWPLRSPPRQEKDHAS